MKIHFFVGFWVWGIHFWGYFLDLVILEKKSWWSPSEIQKWDNLRSNGGRITWIYTFCGFLSIRNPFQRVYFRFSHINILIGGGSQWHGLFREAENPTRTVLDYGKGVGSIWPVGDGSPWGDHWTSPWVYRIWGYSWVIVGLHESPWVLWYNYMAKV